MSRTILHITQPFGHLHLWINLLSTAEKEGDWMDVSRRRMFEFDKSAGKLLRALVTRV